MHTSTRDRQLGLMVDASLRLALILMLIALWSVGDAGELKASSVNFFYVETVEIHTIQAADVDSRHFRAGLRVGPDRERLNATGCEHERAV